MASAFFKLGLASFGGPVAHIGYFRREFVEKRRWLDDSAFSDTVALCQLLPGPASSQVAFSLGMQRAGIWGGVVASVCFLIPSAVAMVLFAYEVGNMGDPSHAGWLHGLRLAAVAVVAVALWGMARNLCPDWLLKVMAACAAAVVLLFQFPWVQVTVILFSALIGILSRSKSPTTPESGPRKVLSHSAAGVLLGVFALLLVILPVLSATTGSRSLKLFDSFYRSGAMVFGGGHVVLPLLRSEFVPTGWTSDSTFVAGYGAVQAMPGPLFSFAGYLGTVVTKGGGAWIGGVLALVAIFLPGWLLVAGVLPFWNQLKGRQWFQGAVRGAGAAVVGLLFAALCTPLIAEGIRNLPDAVAATAAVVLLARFRMPQWALVLLMAAVGQWVLR